MSARFLVAKSLALAVTLGCLGCASSSDMQTLRNQISELQEQVAALKRTTPNKEDVQSANAKIGEQNAVLLKSNTTLVTKVDQLEERLATQQGAAEQLGYRVDKLGQQMTQVEHDLDEVKARAVAPPVAVPAPVAVPSPAMPVTIPQPAVVTGESPTAIYQDAYRDYQQARYDLAISGFQEFIQKYPTSELADNAAYWIGECLYSQKKFRESVAQFDRVVNGYPHSEKVPSALLKKGYAYISLGDKAEGIVQLQYVVHEHPKSPEAAKAREELKKLGVETR